MVRVQKTSVKTEETAVGCKTEYKWIEVILWERGDEYEK